VSGWDEIRFVRDRGGRVTGEGGSPPVDFFFIKKTLYLGFEVKKTSIF